MSEDNTVVRRGEGSMRNPIQHRGLAPDFRGRKLYCIQVQTGIVALAPGGPPVKTFAWVLVLEDGMRFNLNEFETENDGITWAENLAIAVTPGAPEKVLALGEDFESGLKIVGTGLSPAPDQTVADVIGQKPAFCPACGVKAVKNWKFCAACGERLV